MTNRAWNGGNGSWNTASQWTPSGVPSKDDNVLLDASGTYTVTISANNDAADDLTLSSGATLAIARGEAFTVDGAFGNDGLVTVGAGAVLTLNSGLTTAQLGNVKATGGGALNFQGTLDNDDATLNVNADESILGTIEGGTIAGVLNVSAPTFESYLSLYLKGSPTFTGAGGTGAATIDLTGASGGLFILGVDTIANANITLGGEPNFSAHAGEGSGIYIGAGDELILASNATIEQVGPSGVANQIGGPGGEFVNEGAITVAGADGPTSLFISVSEFMNVGSIDISTGSVTIQSTAFSNTGTITVDGPGDLAFDDLVTTAELGAIDMGAGAFLEFDGGLDNREATLDLADDIYVTGAIEGGAIEGAVNAFSDVEFTDGPVFTGVDGVGPGTINLRYADNINVDFSDELISNVTINVEAPSTLSYADARTLAFDDTVTLSSSVTINVVSIGVALQGQGTTTDEGAITGAGDLYISGGTTTFADGASLTVASVHEERPISTTSTPALSIDEVLDYAGNFEQDSFSTLTIASDDAFVLSGVVDLGGTITGAGSLELAGGSAAIHGGATLSVAHWSISGDASVALYEPWTYEGAFNLAGASTLDLLWNLTLAGTATLSGGTITGGRIFITDGATTVSGLSLEQTTIWANAGTATQSGDDVTLSDDAILYNTSTGVYDITDDGGVALGAGAASYINNAGLFEKTGGGATSVIAASILNSGEIDVDSGTLELLGQLWGTGHVDVGAGATLDIGGAPGAAATSTLDSNGVLTFGVGATLALAGENFASTKSLNFDGATLAGDDRLFTYGATSVSGLAIGGTSVWENFGAVTQAGGDVTVGDASGAVAILFNGSAGVYDISDDSGVKPGASSGSYINNAGLFEKTGGSASSVISANMYSAGTIEAASGTLDFQAALWGPGTSKVDAGATLEVDGVVGGRSILAFSGSGGVIALDDLYAAGVNLFHGTIQGFAAGDTIDAGAFGAGTSVLFTENGAGTGGALTLTNGGATASFAMTGVYATTNFTPTSDGHGGTLLTYHA
jgi:fibronectin-binding autotransporter adhesin